MRKPCVRGNRVYQLVVHVEEQVQRMRHHQQMNQEAGEEKHMLNRVHGKSRPRTDGNVAVMDFVSHSLYNGFQCNSR